MMRAAIVLTIAALLTIPETAMASCQFTFSAQSASDLIHVMNTSSADNVVFRIYDNSGTQEGNSVDTGSIPLFGRYVTKVGDLYKAASVATSRIKDTYIVGTESSGDEMVLQFKTAGSAYQVPQRAAGGGTTCE
jgi:hypothetical protein